MSTVSSAWARERGNWVWVALLLLLALIPLPFGANRPWAWSLMALWSSILLLGWAVSLLLGREIVWRRTLLVPALIAAMVIAWILATLIPGMGREHPVWQIAAEQLGHALPGRQTLSVEVTLVALFRLLAYLIIFWLSVQHTRNRARAEQLLAWISWLGTAYALYGLANYFAGNTKLLWYPRWASLFDVSSTFVNRNHYATFAGLTLIAAIAVGMAAYRRAWQLSDRSLPPLARVLECLAGRPTLYFLMALIIATAWMQTHSRMGVAAGALGVVVMLGLMMAVGLVRRRIAPWAILVLVAVGLFHVSGVGTLSRLGDKGSDETRWSLYSIVTEQIASAPYTGSGYGSFAQAFPMYRDTRLPDRVNFSQAHNSYLELAAELGIPMAALFIIMVGWCVMLCFIGIFRRQRDQLYAIVAISASVLVGTHALLDFSLQVPAVAALYAAMLGMGVSQSWSRGGRNGEAG